MADRLSKTELRKFGLTVGGAFVVLGGISCGAATSCRARVVDARRLS